MAAATSLAASFVPNVTDVPPPGSSRHRGSRGARRSLTDRRVMPRGSGSRRVMVTTATTLDRTGVHRPHLHARRCVPRARSGWSRLQPTFGGWPADERRSTLATWKSSSPASPAIASSPAVRPRREAADRSAERGRGRPPRRRRPRWPRRSTGEDARLHDREASCARWWAAGRVAPGLRIATDRRRLQVQIGPYVVLGRYHGPLGATTLRTFAERDPMVPLTDATIAYVVGGVEVIDCPDAHHQPRAGSVVSRGREESRRAWSRWPARGRTEA